MMIGIGMALTLPRGGGTAFSPLTLFSSGEPGAWFDLSDLSTLYQDSAGTVPVTAAGQPVGLVLDKSQGLVLGSELVTNGTFDSNITGWAAIGGTTTLSVVSGRLQVVTGGGYGGTDQTLASGSNRSVRFSFDVQAGSSEVQVQVYDASLGTLLYSNTVAANITVSRNVVVFTQAFSSIRLYIRSVTASTFFLDNISVRELPGNHATQPVASRRPTLIQDENGKYCLSFDGVDDFLVTPTITPNIDKTQVFAGVRRLTDTTGVIAEMSTNWNTSAGSFLFWSGTSMVSGTGAGFNSGSRGDASATSTMAGTSPAVFTPPATAVLAVTHDIAGDLSVVRGNGVAGTNGTVDKGIGNFLAYPLYIGRRAGTLFPFNGNIYSLITRFGPNLDEATIAKTEAWLNTKTGAY